ncbi:hypothetical protein PybrP1_007793 [[Pythium] brassicae (nom. inval.)]|nr:hypothetical protein PybrP1_007793 [[Pythium] brassicae (nom. inval.)]
MTSTKMRDLAAKGAPYFVATCASLSLVSYLMTGMVWIYRGRRRRPRDAARDDVQRARAGVRQVELLPVLHAERPAVEAPVKRAGERLHSASSSAGRDLPAGEHMCSISCACVYCV